MINVKKTKREFLILLEEVRLNSVLDLGCGKGLMSGFFAKKGINVTGIDNKAPNIKLDNFNFILGDMLKEDFGKEHDLIIASLLLHFYKREVALKIIEKMKKSTSIGGYNLVICMSNKDDCAKRRPNNFYPIVQELENVYSDWKIVKKLVDITEIEEHSNLGPHQHHLIFLLVQNKS